MSSNPIRPSSGPTSLTALAAAYAYIAPTKVHWGDMDALGHVNNVVYFKYLENTRLTMMESMGIFPRLFEEGTGLVIADAHCRYKAPVVYPDTLHIGVRAELIGEDRVRFHYALFSESLQRVAAEAETIQVCVSPQTGRKTAMPEWFRESLSRLI
ncbi:acyl-CoA thioesterase [Perlucidibaca aquatica]|uniref:acyl-CoA thioesterase n=1 Tax=Perlucidibaca aquatica TaxID=1852776 RepID=UPI0009EE052E|nr:thioesterase family protein [Perlucidibaca aquatica]